MASSLPSPADCCSPCDGEASVQVPGITGAAGTNGTNGTNGVNAFSTLDGGFTMPAELSNVTVDVSDSTWMGKVDGAISGQVLFVELAGYMEVQSRPTTTSVILKNLQDISIASATSGLLIVGKTYTITTYVAPDDFVNVGGTNVTGNVFTAIGTTPTDWTNASTLTGVNQGAYPGNSVPTTLITPGLQVSPGGLQGTTGSAANAAPDDATYITVTADGALSSEIPLDGKGTGLVTFDDVADTVSVTAIGTADDEQVEVDQAAGLTNGDAVFATANGIETQIASAARTSLGLGTSAIVDTGVADNEVVTVDQGAGLTSGEIAFATAAGIETKTLAAAKTYLGIVAGTTTTTAANPYNLLTTDQVLLYNLNGGVINLPTAVGNDGLQYQIKRILIGGGYSAITAQAGEAIDGALTTPKSITYNEAVTIRSDGADWHLLSNYP